jgi:serine protease AprX
MKMRGTRGARIGVAALSVMAMATVGASSLLTASPAAAKKQPQSSGDAVVSTDWGDISRQEEKQTLDAGAWDPTQDPGSLWSLTAGYGIQRAWAAGLTGRDVTVAVIDTGVAPVPGVTSADDKLVNGPDLSFEGQNPDLRFVDGFGHGTHMAGIIGGEDDAWRRDQPDPSVFAGVAPESQILNMKVGSGDGGVDVSQVIAALNWVVQHRDDAGMHVRVISLAYGTLSPQSWQVDPLARAVEDAWKAGITVVVAAGNDGNGADRLLMPALDPHVLAVGAADTNGTVDPSDDTLADFTSGGSDVRRPDLLAPGKSVVSLRVDGGYADQFSPEGRVAGDGSGRFFRGSGTSQATAFAAGVVALLLDVKGDLKPDQVKALLTSTARPVAGSSAGMVDVPAALALAKDVKTTSSGAVIDDKSKRVLAAPNTAPWSTGAGSLEASRGDEHVVDPVSGVELTGEVDAQGAPWSGTRWAALSGDKKAWDKGTWNGQPWTGDNFDKRSWKFAPWSSTAWTGIPWNAHGNSAKWEARSWRGQDWKARSWREDSWSARSWRALF